MYINSGEILLLTAAGVTGNAPEATLVAPPAFVAVSEQLYVTPLINPRTIKGDPLLDAVRVTCSVAVHVAV